MRNIRQIENTYSGNRLIVPQWPKPYYSFSRIAHNLVVYGERDRKPIAKGMGCISPPRWIPVIKVVHLECERLSQLFDHFSSLAQTERMN